MSHVTCHVSRVTCNVSPKKITKRWVCYQRGQTLFFLFLFFLQFFELYLRGNLGPTLLLFVNIEFTKKMEGTHLLGKLSINSIKTSGLVHVTGRDDGDSVLDLVLV